MKILMQGKDYSPALDWEHPLTIERKLNQPSQCVFRLFLDADAELMLPERDQTLSVCGDDGTIYFSGKVAGSPSYEYVGLGQQGPVYRLEIRALSEEAQFEWSALPLDGEIAGTTAGSLMETLISHIGSSALEMTGPGVGNQVSYFAAPASTGWASRVKQAMTMARVTYRIVNGTVTLTPIETELRTVGECGGGIPPRGVKFEAALDRLPVNDVTLCGEREPVAYVTEYFRGDGFTADYYLSAEPFESQSSHSVIIRELFDEPEIDTRVWSNNGESGVFAIGAAGLSMSAGSGIDGRMLLSWLDPVELGGTLLMEATGVSLSAGSGGVIAGLFDGGVETANCIVGFGVTGDQTSGNIVLQPLVSGSPVGSGFTAKVSNQYTLRVRVHSPELHRIGAIYRGASEDGEFTAGGEWILSPGLLQVEIQEFVNGVGGMPVTLYEGTIAKLPAICTVSAVSSQGISGSMRSFHLTRLGTGWVVSTPAGGGTYTRRIGSPAQGGDCQILSGGRLQFQAGFVPAAGELVAVSYRTTERAIGRAVNLKDQQARAATGKQAVAAWRGSVIEPPARCSMDCRNAALVTATTSATESSVLQGTYRGTNEELDGDVWPGDALVLNPPLAKLESRVTVREVNLSYRSSVPDLIQYQINFANDWAKDLSIQRDSTVPSDAWFQVTPTPTVLPNLSALVVTSLTGNAVTIDAGTAPPTGGGFEVRRRDFEFMAGTDPGLVTRSTQRNFTFSRETANDRFFIRMYDDATPPTYSEFSAALFINLPLVP